MKQIKAQLTFSTELSSATTTTIFKSTVVDRVVGRREALHMMSREEKSLWRKIRKLKNKKQKVEQSIVCKCKSFTVGTTFNLFIIYSPIIVIIIIILINPEQKERNFCGFLSVGVYSNPRKRRVEGVKLIFNSHNNSETRST